MLKLPHQPILPHPPSRMKIVIWFVWFVSFVWLNQTNQMN